MEYKRIEELTTVVTGGTPSTGKREYWDGGNIPWLQSGCCQNCDVNSTEKYITQAGYDNSSARIMPPNTVMIALTGATAGKVGYLNFEACGNQSITGIFPCNSMNQRYLFYYLLSQREKILTDCVGGAQAHISQGYVKNIRVPVLPLSKQKQIVEVLTKLSTVISMQQNEIKALDNLVKARFVEMFGNFVYEPDRWPTCEIGDVADTIDPQPSHRTPPVSVDGIPYIGIAECNYQTRKIAFKSARKVGKDVLKEHKNRYTLDEGDFIIGKIGTIGKPFFLPTDCDYTLSANTVLIKPQKDKISPRFLFAIFESEYMGRIIDAEKKSTSQPAFGIQKVRRIEIPFPPVELQNQFAAFVEEVDKSKVEVQKALDQTQLLFDSLMQQYFG